MRGRELPEVVWQRTDPRDASACADPGFAGTRTALSMTSPKHFRHIENYPTEQSVQQVFALFEPHAAPFSFAGALISFFAGPRNGAIFYFALGRAERKLNMAAMPAGMADNACSC